MRKNSPKSRAPQSKSGRGNFAPVIAVAVVATVGIITAAGWFGHEESQTAGTVATKSTVPIGGPFTLRDQNGQTVSDTEFRGRYMLIYFGYTYCPDVCPTTLARNAAALEQLGKAAQKIQPILITIDPERDTPELLKKYAALFDPRLLALTGTPVQIAKVTKEYKVYYAKVEQGKDPNAYLIDHSAFTYLVGPDGKFLKVFGHDLSAKQMAERLKATM